MKQGDRVFIEGNSSELWIHGYDCMVSTEAYVYETPTPQAKKVLLNIDAIDGYRNVLCSVRRSKVKTIQDCDIYNTSDDAVHPDNTWLWQDISGVVRHLTVMNSYHLYNLKSFIEKSYNQDSLEAKQRISNIESVLKERNYDDESFNKDVEYYEVEKHSNAYDENLILFEGLWILGTGIDKENKWWDKYK